jgi:hypothetical protein
LTLAYAAVVTLINNLTVGSFVSETVDQVQTLNGFQVTCTGGISTSGLGSVGGTTSLLLNGTGTWSGRGTVELNTNINTTGTITVSGEVYFDTKTLTYTAGTVITTDSTLNCLSATTLNTNGISWNNVRFSGTITLSSNLTVTGTTFLSGTVGIVGTNRFTQTGKLALTNTTNFTLVNNINVLQDLVTISGDSTTSTISGFNVLVGGGLDLQGSGIINFSNITLNGTGTWTGNTKLKGNLTIDTSGTINIVDNVYFGTGRLKYTGGTIVTTGSTLNLVDTSTLDTYGIIWNNISIKESTNIDVVLESQLVSSNTLTISPMESTTDPEIVFGGTQGFNVANLVINQQATSITRTIPIESRIILTSGNTYMISNSFICQYNHKLLRARIKSSTESQKAYLYLAEGAYQDLAYLDATDIDSSLGQKIWSFDSDVVNTDNWERLTASSVGTGGGTISTGSSYTWVS